MMCGRACSAAAGGGLMSLVLDVASLVCLAFIRSSVGLGDWRLDESNPDANTDG
jgi:hypothetical protein